MRHSVIIPHRDRLRNLDLCLRSLERSACACGTKAEVVVAQGGPGPTPRLPPGAVVVYDDDHPSEFNKSRLLNLSIDTAQGEVLTFLDADAIVGKRFLDAVGALDEQGVNRVCYRVRYLSEGNAESLASIPETPAFVGQLDELFSHYDAPERFRRGVECYGRHDWNAPPGSEPTDKAPWGNSQFSIRRHDLGPCRFNEQIGWGLEDQEMNAQLEAHFAERYRGMIFTDPEHAMFHVFQPDKRWLHGERFRDSFLIYRRRRRELLDR